MQDFTAHGIQQYFTVYNNNMGYQPKHSEKPEQQFLIILSPGVPLRD